MKYSHWIEMKLKTGQYEKNKSSKEKMMDEHKSTQGRNEMSKVKLSDQPRDWEWCPNCAYTLDTGLECCRCGYDMMPVSNALTQIERERDENERLRADAHRYRWLRDRLEFVDTNQIDNVLSAGVNGCLNQHIDAAISAWNEHKEEAK